MKRVTRLGGDVKKKSTAKVLRVAAYCRVSTGSDAQLESLDAQKTQETLIKSSHYAANMV